MKKNFQNSNDEFNVDDLLKLLHSTRRQQLILAYTCFNFAKERKCGEDKVKYFQDTVKSIKDDFKGVDFNDVLDRLPGLRSIHDSLHDELFGGRVSDDVHISNNERKVAKYNCESKCKTDVAKYGCESNKAKYDRDTVVAKYGCESNKAKYDRDTVVSKSNVACTMMRSDCPVDKDTQENILEVTRLMYTSHSSPNRLQPTQPYEYPPNPLPMHRSSPYPPYWILAVPTTLWILAIPTTLWIFVVSIITKWVCAILFERSTWCDEFSLFALPTIILWIHTALFTLSAWRLKSRSSGMNTNMS